MLIANQELALHLCLHPITICLAFPIFFPHCNPLPPKTPSNYRILRGFIGMVRPVAQKTLPGAASRPSVLPYGSPRPRPRPPAVLNPPRTHPKPEAAVKSSMSRPLSKTNPSRSVAGPSGGDLEVPRPQYPLTKPPVINGVQSGRVQKRPLRTRPWSHQSGGSGCPWVFSTAQTFPWGATTFVDENGKPINTEELSKSFKAQAYINIAIQAITGEQFKIVALVAADVRNLFPNENAAYWDVMVGSFRNFEEASAQCRKGTRGSVKYYSEQLHLVDGICPTLQKSISGYRNLYTHLVKNGKPNDQDFLEVQTKMWGLTYHMKNIGSLRDLFLARADDLRRFDFCLTRTGRSAIQPEPSDLLSMANLAHRVAEGLSCLLSELQGVKEFMIGKRVLPSMNIRQELARTAETKMNGKKTMAQMFERDDMGIQSSTV
ncbi:hypothetical protein TWF281_008664 [Arthrobotrys megalospora]